ncbi:response regulator [Pseudomonas sp. AU10]|uniref:response regulator n=1 Tax=Pseudomonas sp. AU10 TaxID=882697 RepID=UPI0021E24F13|nr:response regulator transcription factor [Pseudomonas sp. AU10]MCV2226891.1 response regulator transcription factor [Pseudomonas sp. AU10]
MNNRILIVDDHPAIVMTLKLLLASEGFDVIADANNGADALRMAEELRPSIMILDIGIPVIGGLAVIANIVAKKLPIKTIVLTGLPPDYLAARCRSLGAHGFVSKKSDLSEMVNAIRAVRMDDEFFPDLKGPQSDYACHPDEWVSLQNPKSLKSDRRPSPGLPRHPAQHATVICSALTKADKLKEIDPKQRKNEWKLTGESSLTTGRSDCQSFPCPAIGGGVSSSKQLSRSRIWQSQ